MAMPPRNGWPPSITSSESSAQCASGLEDTRDASAMCLQYCHSPMHAAVPVRYKMLPLIGQNREADDLTQCAMGGSLEGGQFLRSIP